MAIQKLKEKGYGIVEVNSVSGGQITRSKASLPLRIEDFPSVNFPCEQGMLLVYDEATGEVRKAKTADENVCLHYSEVKLYDENRQALKDFCLFAQDAAKITVQGAVLKADGTVINATVSDTDTTPSSTVITIYSDNDPYPRMLPLLIGDTWTTNTVIYDDAELADFDTIRDTITAGTAVWGSVAIGQTDTSLDGYVKISTTKPTGVKTLLKAIKAYDLPDGQPAIKFEVYAH